MYALARKNHLGKNLARMAKQFPEEYGFFPATWVLPADMSDFRA
jgi:tubulin polyglutamylase TTLL6/13